MELVFVLDCLEPSRLADFWSSALGYHVTSTDDPYVVLMHPERTGPQLILQRVSEPKTVKNRMHLDIRSSELESTVERLAALGAHRVDASVIEEGGLRWIVMADPEGNEFCVAVRTAVS